MIGIKNDKSEYPQPRMNREAARDIIQFREEKNRAVNERRQMVIT